MSSSLFSRIISPTVLLYTFLGVSQFGDGVYFASGTEPSTAFDLIARVGTLSIMCWWLLEDSRKRGVAWVYDMGLFLSIVWIIIMPYHLLKSRGAKGLLVILGFLAAYVGARIAGIVMYMVFAPSAG
jgi:hypothetical protein